METQFCSNGHVIPDYAKNSGYCPICEENGSHKPTAPHSAARPTQPKESHTKDVDSGQIPSSDLPNDNQTKRWDPVIADQFGSKGVDPVVGWLVCVEGVDKGRDYRIRCGYNSIGRDPSMLIHINGDDCISRVNHATILYDSRDKVFTIERKESKHPIRVNDKRISGGEIELKKNDIIDFGQTKLRFVPFCDDQFDWTE